MKKHMTKEEFDKRYKELADKIILPFLVEEHKKNQPNDSFIQRVNNKIITQDKLLDHYYNNNYYYNYYYYNYFNYNYYNYSHHNLDFVVFMQKVNEILTEIFKEENK
jgi:hypothetical protein